MALSSDLARVGLGADGTRIRLAARDAHAGAVRHGWQQTGHLEEWTHRRQNGAAFSRLKVCRSNRGAQYSRPFQVGVHS